MFSSRNTGLTFQAYGRHGSEFRHVRKSLNISLALRASGAHREVGNVMVGLCFLAIDRRTLTLQLTVRAPIKAKFTLMTSVIY